MPEAKQKAVLDKIKKSVTDSQGTLDNEDNWGKKPLAYPIKHEKEGFYFYLEITLPPDRANGINRLVVNDEQVLRHLLVVKSNKKPVRQAQGKQENTKKAVENPKRSRRIDKREKKTETTKSTRSIKGTKKAKK